jgi:diguanylate cyclase (GGDEF)-like protein
MTLFKKIALMVTLVFLLLSLVATAGDFRRAETLLEGQLQTTAQDMATTLGVAISSSIEGKDIPALETLFNAVFDSGYYSRIELVSPDNTVIHKKEQHLQIQGIPDWFIAIAPLKPATGTTQVMQGWTQLGTLRVTLNPGLVYAGLYKNLQTTLLRMGLLLCFGMALLWFMLHLLLKPLEKVKQQADAIHKNEFVQQESLPRTLELRRVVEAMNRMVNKVHSIFDDQEKNLTLYQDLLYIDSLTGLGNRRYIISQLQRLQSEDAAFDGCLALIKIHHADIMSDRLGYEKSEAILVALAATLKKQIDETSNERAARMNDDEFTLLLAKDTKSARKNIEKVFSQFKLLHDVAACHGELWLSAGITRVHSGRELGEILAEADLALTQASVKDAYSITELTSPKISLPQGKMQWRNFLEKSLFDEDFYLVGQEVQNTEGIVLHSEIFVRLNNEQGETLPAGLFIPVAQALGLGLEIDKSVFKLLKKHADKESKIPLAFNLTESFFSHADAFKDFIELLNYFKEHNAKLCVETSHMVVQQHPELCAHVADQVRQLGHTFGIDHFDLSVSLQLMQDLRPDYIKVNAKLLHDMSSAQALAGYQALKTITDIMEIKLIAVAVHSAEIYQHLKDLGVDAMQGDVISNTRELK